MTPIAKKSRSQPLAVLIAVLGIALTWAAATHADESLTGASRISASAEGNSGSLCAKYPYLCTDPSFSAGGEYVGHDEPALLFYSPQPGAGNSFKGLLTLPKDPKTKPNQSGTAGTWNFQLHPAFWFGMALCDTQSYPETTTPCVPDRDTNIFDNPTFGAADYIGNHPGTAFLELQFYPPAWAIAPNNIACSATKWCAAVNIDSLLMDPNNNTFNNNDCGNNLVAGRVGEEPANFAFVTKSGNSVAPADPLTGLGAQVVVTKDVFLMNAGDTLEVRIGDNPGADPNGGLEVIIRDLTTGKSGSMIASIANGFAQVNFAPSASTCTETPYAFHPMYGTSGVHTRVPWTAHSFNVAFSDEIGHFEYCTDVDPITGTCLSGDRLDDFFCLAPSQSSKIKIGGCTFDDLNFDSPSYLLDWPGTLSDAAQDAKLHAQPIRLNGAFIGASDGATHQFDAVAFETDQPSVEAGFGYPCDPTTGAGCVNPPPGAAFYPVYTTTTDANLGCVWQLGGTSIPNTVQSYGDSTAEYGAILGLEYAGLGGASLFFNDFQQALSSNPCAVAMPALSPSLSPIAFKNTRAGMKSAAKTVKLSNTLSNKAGFGVNFAAISTDNPVFAITKNKCTTELLPKKKCAISLTATPTSAGTSFSGNLMVQSDVGTLNIPLTVTGD